MAAKEVKFDAEARNRLLKGVDIGWRDSLELQHQEGEWFEEGPDGLRGEGVVLGFEAAELQQRHAGDAYLLYNPKTRGFTETTVRGIRPFAEGRVVSGVVVRQRRLRWPISPGLDRKLKGQVVRSVTRRAKYILLRFTHGTLMIHLGMSGRLRALPVGVPPGKHDHVDLVLSNGRVCGFLTPGAFVADWG